MHENSVTVKSPGTYRIFALISYVAIIAVMVYAAFRFHSMADAEHDAKRDFFDVNQIRYGILSGKNWSLQLQRIIQMQVDSFDIGGSDKKIVKEQLNGILMKLIDEADRIIHKKQQSFKDKIRFSLISAFVDLDEVRAQVPRFSDVIIQELDKPDNRQRVKALITEKMKHVLGTIDPDTSTAQSRLLAKYTANSRDEFNNIMRQRFEKSDAIQNSMAILLIAGGVLSLLIWIFIRRQSQLWPMAFALTVICGLILLVTGVSLPMIEIDARIDRMELEFLSSRIIFDEQIIFYRAKSIIQVVQILVRDAAPESKFVGGLIFLFSVVFPLLKLIAAGICMRKKERSGKFVRFIALKTGKWSMADVMAVAIFMSFIGFRNIVDSQLRDINMHNETINLISTNRTSLLPAYFVFVMFCIFNLVLAEILKKTAALHEKGVPGTD
jgi:hypothetical protein